MQAVSQMRKRVLKAAKQRLKELGPLPYTCGSYRVLSLGSLSQTQYCTLEYLWPVGFRAAVALRHAFAGFPHGVYVE
jgi:hypothetical protein